jgi:hypothetical protein
MVVGYKKWTQIFSNPTNFAQLLKKDIQMPGDAPPLVLANIRPDYRTFA